MPHNIRAQIDCQSSMAVLSWQPGTGAMPLHGHSKKVNLALAQAVKATISNCELTGLACGESYNITVLAEGETCNSTATMRGHLNTGEQKHLLE